MNTALYILIAIPLLLFVAIVAGFLIAAGMDWYHNYKYGAWIALQEDHTKPRRPAAK